MKAKRIYSVVLALFALLCFYGCSIESDKVGHKLGGMWHLTAVEVDGVKTDYSDKKVYWLFQGKLLQLEDKEYVHPSILYLYTLEGDVVKLRNPYRYDRENGDELLTEPSLLQYYGIDNIGMDLWITVNDSRLIFTSGNRKLYFDKF